MLNDYVAVASQRTAYQLPYSYANQQRMNSFFFILFGFFLHLFSFSLRYRFVFVFFFVWLCAFVCFICAQLENCHVCNYGKNKAQRFTIHILYIHGQKGSNQFSLIRLPLPFVVGTRAFIILYTASIQMEN